MLRVTSGKRMIRKRFDHQQHVSVLSRFCMKGWRYGSTKASTVEIGGVIAPLKQAEAIELVPRGYLPQLYGREIPQELLSHLRWMLQKDILKQDMFLIGPPGPSRRLLSMQFCELMNKEVEYVAISQDTTESDLKQRREIIGGAAIFTDQAPVRAAIHGRVLVIDGLEKAERNVLPTLNNLLENREMTLDDGRFLMKAESYDALLAAGYSKKDLQAQNLVRVHPDFRVIALGVPVPPYPGRTLDPPLRSRFQARNIQPASPGTQLESLVAVAPTVPLPLIERLVGVREAVNAIEMMQDGMSAQRMPHFDEMSLSHCVKVLQKFPESDFASILRRVFPVRKEFFNGSKGSANCDTMDRILKKFGAGIDGAGYDLKDIEKIKDPENSNEVAKVSIVKRKCSDSDSTNVKVKCGTLSCDTAPMPGFVETETHRYVFMEMLQDHAVGGDLCIFGEKGSGKSDLVRLFAHRLGYATELFSLFKDMTARDLLQRRATDSTGNTHWEDSPLIYAARNGHLAVLDGVHRLGGDSLSVLQRLVQDREIDLMDGSKLVSQAKYDQILQDQGTETKGALRVHPIHPSFRIISIAECDPNTDGVGSGRDNRGTVGWLNSDSISMFCFHLLPSTSRVQTEEIVAQLYPQLPQATRKLLLSFVDKLKQAKQTAGGEQDYAALSLSLRQILRLCRRLNAFPEQSLVDFWPLVHDTLLTQFLPSSCGRLVDCVLKECGAPLPQTNAVSLSEQTSGVDQIVVNDDALSIGDVSFPVKTPENPELVPQPHYFDIPKHTKVMKEMLQDVVSGQKHLLLIGNQGVGKNKLADRLLQLLQQEREYVQLHRDTTVQTLTLVPTLVDGKIVWEDSPLVRAAKAGRTLVVDEADKAPLEVVCVLKGLIEDGEMLLGNGKRLIDPTKVSIEPWHDKERIIELHPDFRMWVLANRPGFPFLGNNFFREIGDIFASHAIDNPDEESELALLQAYAPRVPVEILKRLCKAFAELRELVENGTITYPYSTREAVAVAKHLEKFPNDGVTSVLENVLAFDAYDKNLRKQLSEVFLRHNIPLSSSDEPVKMAISLGKTYSLPPFMATEEWKSSDNNQVSEAKALSSRLPRRSIWFEPATTRSFSVRHHRLEDFSELLATFQVPLKFTRNQRAHAITVFPDQSIHVLACRPMSLHSFSNYQNDTSRTHKILQIEHDYMEWEKNPVLVPLVSSEELGIFVPTTGLCLYVNPSSSDGEASCFSLPKEALSGQEHGHSSRKKSPKLRNPLSKLFSAGGSELNDRWKTHQDSTNPGMLLRFEFDGPIVQVIDFNQQKFHSVNLEKSLHREGIVHVQTISNNKWLVRSKNDKMAHILSFDSATESFNLNQINISNSDSDRFANTSGSLVTSTGANSVLNETKLIMVHSEAFLQVVEPFKTSLVKSSLRKSDERREGISFTQALSEGKCVVNTAFDGSKTDIEVVYPDLSLSKKVMVDLVDTNDRDAEANPVVDMVELEDGNLATLQRNGQVSIWQMDYEETQKDLNLWKQMYGVVDDEENLSLKINGKTAAQSSPRTGLDAPKHGKDDPRNDPHVGGNTWAGGTGGSDTAGLGGRGGPYRLDKGHPVHQISQAKKNEVSKEAREKARAMAEEALAEKLEAIDMSDKEWKAYQAYFSRVEHESSQLRSILENLQSFSEERTWLKHQSSGELDDAKLVDGVTGERLVFKRRGVSDSPFQGGHQELPKVMLFVMDVSGSMYRFNGQDGRLERVLETSLMIMESFAGFENKFDFCIMGHSGDSPEIPFVEFGKPPKDRKERLKVLQKMVAHSQYCRSGDYTVEAVNRAVKRVVNQEADDYFVFVVSDANLERYNIDPKRLGKQLVSDKRVKANAIFIASFADEAERILADLPQGRGFVCLDTTDLPKLFKKIFTTAFGSI